MILSVNLIFLIILRLPLRLCYKGCMRVIALLGFLFAILLGASALIQLDTLSSTIQSSAPATLSNFVGLWPALLVMVMLAGLTWMIVTVWH